MDSLQESWYLRKADIIKRLTPQELETLYASSQRITKTRNEEIWPDEDETPKAYIIDQGFLRVCRMNDDGKRFILAMLGPGDFFGSLTAGIDSDEQDEYWEVVRDVRLIAIDAAKFHETLGAHSDMTMRLAQMLEQRRRMLEKRLTSMLFKDVTARTAEVVIEFCSKFGEVSPKYPDQRRSFTLTHQELADLVGAARPVVSGVISDLTKLGILIKDGRLLTIDQEDELKRVAELGAKALA